MSVEDVSPEFRWPKKIQPLSDESLPSYLNRFARENGLASRRQLLSALDFSTALHVRDEDIPRLAGVLGVEKDLLEKIAWSNTPNFAAKRRSMIRAKGEAVCSTCLVDGPYSRQIWSHRMATCCPQHGQRLIDRCSLCSASIRHDRWHPCFCECGADLRLQVSLSATRGEKIFSKLLIGEKLDDDVTLNLQQSVPSDIDLFVLGLKKHFFSDGSSNKTGLPALSNRVSAVAHDFMPVFETFERGLLAVDLLLQELVGVATSVKSAGTVKRFGAWYKLLFRTFKGSAYSLWRERAATVIASTADILVNARTRNIQALASGSKGWTSVAEAARLLKVSAERLHGGIDDGRILAQERGLDSCYRQRFLAKSELDKLMQIRSEHINDTAAQRFLGVPKSVFKLMNEAGWFIRSDASLLPPVLSGSIQKGPLEVLMRTLRQTNKIKLNTSASQCTALRELTLRTTTNKHRLVSLYVEIASGSISAVGHDGSEGLGGLLLANADIDQRLSRTSGIPCLTVEQVCSLTGAHTDAVKSWINDELLVATKSLGQHGNPWQVQIADLVNFLMSYASLASLASSCGSTSRGVSSTFARLKIPTHKPASGRGELVRQVDLIRALL